jgi:DNA end-binding protein Ku
LASGPDPLVWSRTVAPRAYWKGYLKLSLVSCPIALYPATSEREKISFHQINKKTGNRIKYRKVDSDTGDEVEPSEIMKGYEVGKGEYLELDPEELEAIAIESKRVIDIDEFVPKKEIDEIYLNSPYYILPDGEVGQQAFAVIREAINKEGMVAIGKVVFTSREHVIALEARGKGMLGVTLPIPTKYGTKQVISTTSPTRRFQRTCWSWPRTSSIPRRLISIRRGSRTDTRTR